MSESSLEDVSAFIKIPKEVKFIPNSHQILDSEENSIIIPVDSLKKPKLLRRSFTSNAGLRRGTAMTKFNYKVAKPLDPFVLLQEDGI